MKPVFIVEGDVVTYDDSTWIDGVYSSLEAIPEDIAKATVRRTSRKQTYTVYEWIPDEEEPRCQWIWDGFWQRWARG